MKGARVEKKSNEGKREAGPGRPPADEGACVDRVSQVQVPNSGPRETSAGGDDWKGGKESRKGFPNH